MNEEKIKKHREELENEWRYLKEFDTREQRDHELLRGYLHDAPERFGERELKAGMNNSEMMAPENQTEKTLELLWMGENNSHNQKQLWKDGIKIEPWIFERMEQDLEETLLQSSNPRMTTRITTTNYWGTPEWRIERLNKRWKEFDRSWRNTNDWW